MKINNFHLNFLPFSKFKYTKKQQLDIFMVRVSKMDWMRHKWIFIEKIETWKSFLKSPLKITVRSFKWRKFSNRKYRFYTYGNLKLFYSSNGYNNSRISLFHKVYGPFSAPHLFTITPLKILNQLINNFYILLQTSFWLVKTWESRFQLSN